jgi:hypothetical protein
MGTGGGRAHKKLLGDLVVGEALSDQSEDFGLSVGKSAQERVRVVRMGLTVDELFDHCPGDRRRKQRATVMNGSDRGQQCRGRRVLTKKPLAPISSASNT